ncbi:MAG: hypothetical protein R3F02_18515 [Thiolinea sp.]
MTDSMTIIATAAALNDVADEMKLARAKFPSPQHMMTAITEEAGELAQALLDKPMAEVRKEAIQLACVALRIACEGDPTHNAFRQSKGLDTEVPVPLIVNTRSEQPPQPVSIPDHHND